MKRQDNYVDKSEINEELRRIINIFGSVSEAYRVTGITKSTILSQCRHKTKTHPRCGYYFRFLEEFDFDGFVL